MNTPSHYVLNLAVIGAVIQPRVTAAITLGAIGPDLPIFVFYAWAKFIQRLPESEIWSQAYYQPFWQTIIALTHSFPVAIVGLLICLALRSHWGLVFFISMIGHSLLDLPVHNDDAHRHFFPLSNYRFMSPISYWDPNHYGPIVAGVEMLLVIAATPFVWPMLETMVARIILVTIPTIYVVGYSRFYLSGAIAQIVQWFS
ncbi:MAG: hypothetical protein F6J87_27075 [Spirulina sp. SIO3F2]|nr:hypothetical protein [Spirulina sp. SIO3F2]